MPPGQGCFQERDAWGKGALMEQTNSNLRGGKALQGTPVWGPRQAERQTQSGGMFQKWVWSGSKSLVLSHQELRGVLED